jgi:4-hydroxy-tetrahydrodipicolinate synthase
MFSGSMVAIVTPMTADGGLDWPAWDRLLDFHAREGTDGIVVAGTTGESPSLLPDEVEELTRRAVGRCRGKLKVIVGAGTHSTAATVARTRTLSRLGVDATDAGDPVLQQTAAGGPLQALHGRRGCLCSARYSV